MIIWIIIAVILLLLLLILAFGWWRLQQKKIRLESEETSHKAGKELYHTAAEFSFSNKSSLPSAEKPMEIVSLVEERITVPVAEQLTAHEIYEGSQNTVISPVLGEDVTLSTDSTQIVTDIIELETSDAIISIPDTPTELTTEISPPNPSALPEIDTPQGRLERLRGRLGKSQSAMSKSMLGLIGGADLDEESWEEIEDSLITADIGTHNAMEIVKSLRSRISAQGIHTSDEAKKIISQVLVEYLHPEWDRSIHAMPEAGKPAVILVVGVNGTGKTSTTGKLARVLMAHNITVHLAAVDTFRAAAADQLELWAKRSGATITRAAQGTDPSSVAYDGVARAIADNYDAVIVDTAGRLHNKVGLMDELAKVKRVVEKQAIVTETLLVLDATIGQNGLLQAKTFAQSVELTGVVLTKLDGTAKGGIVFQVQDELHVPLKLVGLGEGPDDLAPFDPQAFVQALLN